MFNRLLIISGSVLLGTTLLAPSAFAQSVEIQMVGVVLEQATVSIPNGDAAEMKVSRDFTKKDKVFQAVDSRNLSFNSNRPVTVIISPPKLLLGSTLDSKATVRRAELKRGTDNTAIVNETTASLGVGLTNLQLETTVQRPQDFAPGNYNYAVTLTVVPQ
jgi:hypothetical protein